MAAYNVEKVVNKSPKLKTKDAVDAVLSKDYDLSEGLFAQGGELDLLLGINVCEIINRYIMSQLISCRITIETS